MIERFNSQAEENDAGKVVTNTERKRGVSRKLERLLKPDNVDLGGKPI